MNPIDFGGQRSKVKVTMDMYGNKLVNTIETTPLHISLSNFVDMLTMLRGWTLLILEVRGQRSRSQWTYMEVSLWTRWRLNRCGFIYQTWQTYKPWQEDAPYLFFRGQRSKVKVTMDIYGNTLVNRIETKPLCASWSNLADMLAMVREWTLLILEVKGQGHNGYIWK